MASLALAVAVGCGRVDFDPVGNARDSSAADTAVDAVAGDSGDAGDTAPPLDAGPSGPVTLVKLTPTAPIFMPSDDPADDHYYLISTRGVQRPASFTWGSRVYFSTPSKSGDASSGGWHYALFHWTPGDASAVWVDGDEGPGEQAVVPRDQTDTNGFELRNHQVTHFVEADGALWGLSRKWFSLAEYPDVGANGYHFSPVRATDPDAFTASDFLVDERRVIETDTADSTWRGATTQHIDLFFRGGTMYVYQTQLNAPLSNTLFIAVSTTTDLATFEAPTTFLLEGYARPHVFEVGGRLYMVAFHYASLGWQLIPGSAVDSFDPARAVDLELGNRLHGTGAWDDTPFFTDLPGGEPRLAGVEVIAGRIYLFYLAGGFSQLPADPQSGGDYHGVPYDGPRGVGVFEMTIDE